MSSQDSKRKTPEPESATDGDSNKKQQNSDNKKARAQDEATGSTGKHSRATDASGSSDGGAPVHPDAQTIEKGLIFFFYRPRVEKAAAQSADDVQRLFILLVPGTVDPKHVSDASFPKRLLIVGRKMLPSLENHARVWCFVDIVSSGLDAIDEVLGKQRYSTTTRGERHIEPARMCGEGVYCLVSVDNHTHLAYHLDLPAEPGEAQKAFHIEQQGSYVLSVKNPKVGGTPGLARAQKAQLPERLQELFAGRRWVPAVPGMLDHAGVELLLIGVSGDLHHEYGEDMGAELHEMLTAHQHGAERLGAAHVFDELHLPKGRPAEKKAVEAPLKTGEFA